MLRIFLAIAATALMINSSQAYMHTRAELQNRGKCKTMVDSKHLKGDAYKGEFSKCMVNPDNYK
jgi:hypothetical protein